jgi:hypothetical protein
VIVWSFSFYVCGLHNLVSGIEIVCVKSHINVFNFCHIVAMRWFQGGIAEAVAASKARNAIFVVFVEGWFEVLLHLD